LVPSKDAMEVITEKAVELVESKQEEILEKVEEVAEQQVDAAEKAIEETASEVGKKLEDVAAPIADIVDKLDDNPQVAAAIETLVTAVDGREISCSCFGFLFALRISRKSKRSPPAKPEETVKVESATPSQDSEAKESSPPKAPQSE